MKKGLPLRATMCATCPFRDGSPYAYLAPDLAEAATTQKSRICHSTGSNNAINRRTGKRPALCRGARDIQLRFFAAKGFIAEPTDEAWAEQCRKQGIEPPKIVENKALPSNTKGA